MSEGIEGLLLRIEGQESSVTDVLAQLPIISKELECSSHTFPTADSPVHVSIIFRDFQSQITGTSIPSRTSLNWAKRAPGLEPVDARDDIISGLCENLVQDLIAVTSSK